jgi:chemotaxis protein CheD
MGSTILPPPRAFYRPPNAPYFFVSVADMRISNVPNAVISTLGLGSCLGVTCYDPARRVGGLLHTMLPDSQKHRAANPSVPMYLDLGLPELVDSVVKLGADIRRLEFKVFGGAQILQSNDYFSIGRQNIQMMQQLVDRFHLPIKAWDVGGQLNRSIEIYLDTGRVLVRMPSRPETWI